ncbi:hypothetical protein MG293_012186 [Ovis ammon polii]|uniref:Uncharacterized protein n=1 Tax=Ovis ammon polii TaxID=230172 RepID=A0AAD4U0K4_OVIAM|nr:hypothetical protein MG293_012186 [Ovis ammon polii]KAI4564526.1 hypothetical protein MJT46_010324 [Ovis ammon polii x Ovis aries]
MDSPLRCPVRGKTRSKECDYVVLGEEVFPQSTIFSSIWISMASQVPCTAPQAATVLLLKTQYKARSKDWSKLTQQKLNSESCQEGCCDAQSPGHTIDFTICVTHISGVMQGMAEPMGSPGCQEEGKGYSWQTSQEGDARHLILEPEKWRELQST